MSLTAASVSTISAIFEDLDPSQVKEVVRPEPLLRARSIAWIRFERSDLSEQRRFLEDFGIRIAAADDQNLYGCGTGPSPFFYHARKGKVSRFVGIGFEVATRADLEIAARFAGAGPIEAETGPGGGERVAVVNPDGFVIEYVYGRMLREQNDLHPARASKRRHNQPVRPALKPAEVIKLGHVVLQTVDIDRTLEWWMRHVGILPSDAQVLADGGVMLAFCRLDCGNEPTDHHTVAIAGGVANLYMHSAYEVPGLDAVGQGQQVLKAGGWKHGWGIGRHHYGSQIFDYWRDPVGDLMEHYTDGDMYDDTIPTRYSRFTRGSTWMWGQDQPKDFDGLDFATFRLMIGNLMSRKLRWSRLKLLLQAVKAAPRPWLK